MTKKEKNDKTIEKKKKLPKYESPKIEEYNEDELLKNVAVLGCYPFPP